ncbi:MAG: isoaspartyl peptidase/L-asparaginase [Brumimicrobium sp.]
MKKNLKLFILPFIILACTNNSSDINNKVDEASLDETTKVTTPRLVIHGGAGTITEENLTPELEKAYHEKLTEALDLGYSILEKGGTSSEAVIAVIQLMEKSPLFNAGIGAVFTHEETNELDASFMDGKTGKAGAVAGVSRIKSPIEAAFTVMNSSPHVMLSGEGAEVFAKEQGLEMVEPSYFYNEKRYQQLLKIKERESKGKKSASLKSNQNDYKYGTVGAVALDKNGDLAAGTSTGGMTNKKFGRIGDSPIIGAGTYADNSTCAVSSTGHGEFFIRNVTAYDIAARMKYKGESLKVAAQNTINNLEKIEGFGGVICLDAEGNFTMPFNTAGMYRGWILKKGEANVKMFKN